MNRVDCSVWSCCVKDNFNDSGHFFPTSLTRMTKPSTFNQKSSAVSQEAIAEMQQAILGNNTIVLAPAQIKNLLVYGAPNSGKTTISNVLQNPCYCPKRTSLSPDNKSTCFREFSVTDERAHNFKINLIDTPGNFEVRASKEEVRQQRKEEIARIVTECIDNEITDLNLLVLVINATKFSTTELELVETTLELFGERSIPTVLCLTHADRIASGRRVEIEQVVQECSTVAKYFEKHLLKVHWMGCVDYLANGYTDENIMFRDYKLVANWRREFLETIFRAETCFKLDELSIKELSEMNT